MRLKFGDCVLDLHARQLERGNKVVPLEPKMYELLEVLIKRRPAVGTKNELDELLWPNLYVVRTSLTRLVSELREMGRANVGTPVTVKSRVPTFACKRKGMRGIRTRRR